MLQISRISENIAVASLKAGLINRLNHIKIKDKWENPRLSFLGGGYYLIIT